MMQKEPLYIRFWNQPIWIHFIVWTLISSTFTTCLGFLISEGEILPLRFLMGVILISCLFGLCCTCMVWLAKRTEKFCSDISDFQERARLAKTKETLQLIRSELVQYYKENAWHRNHADFVKPVIVFIDTRLDYDPMKKTEEEIRKEYIKNL